MHHRTRLAAAVPPLNAQHARSRTPRSRTTHLSRTVTSTGTGRISLKPPPLVRRHEVTIRCS
eukprot:scaffold139232_cov136-Phaeocystis_antarctica.AAC.1